MQDLPDQHARDTEVVGVFARAGGFARRVDHRDGIADNGKVSRVSGRWSLPLVLKSQYWPRGIQNLHSATHIAGQTNTRLLRENFVHTRASSRCATSRAVAEQHNQLYDLSPTTCRPRFSASIAALIA